MYHALQFVVLLEAVYNTNHNQAKRNIESPHCNNVLVATRRHISHSRSAHLTQISVQKSPTEMCNYSRKQYRRQQDTEKGDTLYNAYLYSARIWPLSIIIFFLIDTDNIVLHITPRANIQRMHFKRVDATCIRVCGLRLKQCKHCPNWSKQPTGYELSPDVKSVRCYRAFGKDFLHICWRNYYFFICQSLCWVQNFNRVKKKLASCNMVSLMT